MEIPLFCGSIDMNISYVEHSILFATPSIGIVVIVWLINLEFIGPSEAFNIGHSCPDLGHLLICEVMPEELHAYALDGIEVGIVGN